MGYFYLVDAFSRSEQDRSNTSRLTFENMPLCTFQKLSKPGFAEVLIFFINFYLMAQIFRLPNQISHISIHFIGLMLLL